MFPSPQKIRSVLPWLPAYAWQRCVRRQADVRPVHLVIGLADHFEPSNRPGAPGTFASHREQVRRVEKWCGVYPHAMEAWRDDEGKPFRHTYFFPAEEFDEALIDRLAEHCHAGWGEIEIQLHHGIRSPDTAENTRRQLLEFRSALASRGCLSRLDGIGQPRYAFVHGNWALANSAHGRFCGVDDEMQILEDTGCYADCTLPAAPSPQVGKINSLYECSLPLNQRAPHRRGRNLQSGQPPNTFPLIIEGPLLINFGRRKGRWPNPGIENGELSGRNPATIGRLRLWREAAITVQGRSDWIFIKLHCHGMTPLDEPAMLGIWMQDFLRDLIDGPGNRTDYYVHFVTVREMTNIILAACDGRAGNPGEHRDYRFQLIHSPSRN